ncbi:MAG: TIM44-like domain-containing protein [Chthoniobacteraceae bacterium]
MARPIPRFPRAKWTLAALLVLLSVDYVLARAGGGHSSGSHSSGGSSGGGSISFAFDIIRFLFWFDTTYPIVGIPVTIGIGYGCYKIFIGGQTVYQGNVINRGASAASSNLVSVGFRALRATDASFDTAVFTARVRDGFTKLQHAWCEQSLVSVRPFISDGIHERFSLQFDEQRALGYRPVMENLSILECAMAQVECGPVFDVITMRIGATAKDYRVSVETGRAIPGSEEEPGFVEYWSFIRARGNKTTPNRAGLIEGNCPNCGAPIAMNQGAKCEYCHAVLRSGQYDWVLAEITQEEEWQPCGTPPPGTQAIRESDPGFTLQDLEDTASVVFWRKAAADRVGRIDPMRKVATPACCESYAATLAIHGDGSPRQIFCDSAVSAVDTVGVISGDGEDRALVDVCWMGRAFEADPSGRLRDLGGTMSLRHSLFVLTRKAGVKSTPENSISSAHCPNCGGAVMADTSNACEFCHTVLNDGTRGWVLRDIFPSSSDEARALRAEAVAGSQRDAAHFQAIGSPARASGTGALAWMIQSAVSGGLASDDSVRAMLRVTGEKNGLAADRVDELVRAASAGQVDIPAPADITEARAWLLEIAIAAMIAGGISKQEAALIRTTGTRNGLPPADVNYVMQCARREAFTRAKTELRTAKVERRTVKAEQSPGSSAS